MERIAIFPGSFDPFTKGHESILQRGLSLFDRIIIGVGINMDKHTAQSTEQRIAALRKLFAADARIEVEGYTGLTVDFAARHHAAFILRGVRSMKDYEYEMTIADINRRLSGIETVILFSEPQWAFLSSSMVKELKHFGKDITPFIPDGLEYE